MERRKAIVMLHSIICVSVALLPNSMDSHHKSVITKSVVATPKSALICQFAGKSSQATLLAREAFITDLARSGKMTLYDAAALPVGAKLDIAYKVVGSCTEVDGRLVLNVRTINVNGQIVAGAAESVSGELESATNMGRAVSAKLEPRLLALLNPSAIAAKPVSKTATNIKSAIYETSAPVKIPEQPTSKSLASLPPATPTDTVVRTESASRQTRVEPVLSYTGVIIDTRGLSLNRSMSPVIRRIDGSKLWTGGDADPDYVIGEGIVVYAFTMDSALQELRAGKRPLMLKAAAKHDTPFSSDPLLSEEDAEQLTKYGQRDGFLKEYHVVFVVDR